MADQLGTEIFLASQQMIGCAIEANRGTPETLADEDFNILVMNLKVTPVFDENTRKYAVGDPYPFNSIFGAQKGIFKFDMPMQGSGSDSADPVFFKVLQLGPFQIGDDSLARYALLKLPNATATMGFYEIQNAATTPVAKKYIIKGAGATKMSIHYDDSGKLQMLSVEIEGALVEVANVANGDIPTPVLDDDDSVVPSVLGITSQFTPAGGSAFPLTSSTMTIDLGLKAVLIKYVQDDTGYAYVVCSDFDLVQNVEIFIPTETALASYAALTNNGTNGELENTLGTGANKELQFLTPNAQIVKALEVGNREGIDSMPVMFRAIRPEDGDPFFGIFQPKA